MSYDLPSSTTVPPVATFGPHPPSNQHRSDMTEIIVPLAVVGGGFQARTFYDVVVAVASKYHTHKEEKAERIAKAKADAARLVEKTKINNAKWLTKVEKARIDYLLRRTLMSQGRGSGSMSPEQVMTIRELEESETIWYGAVRSIAACGNGKSVDKS